jgi:hypothetical protein
MRASMYLDFGHYGCWELRLLLIIVALLFDIVARRCWIPEKKKSGVTISSSTGSDSAMLHYSYSTPRQSNGKQPLR